MKETDESYHRFETSYGYYRRRVELPTDMKAGKVGATYNSGIVKLKFRKSKEADTRIVKVKTD